MLTEKIIEARVPVEVAAKLLGISVLSMQGALIHKALPVGGAWKNDGSTCYVYHISPHLLGQYIGVDKSVIYEVCEAHKNAKKKV